MNGLTTQDRRQMHEMLVAFWTYQHSRVLTYRALFIALEALLTSLALVALAVRRSVIAGLLSPLGLFLALLWRHLCDRYRYDAAYFRWQILKHEAGEVLPIKVLTTGFHEWHVRPVTEKRSILLADKRFGAPVLHSPATRVLDGWLPSVSMGIWVMILAFIASAAILSRVM